MATTTRARVVARIRRRARRWAARVRPGRTQPTIGAVANQLEAGAASGLRPSWPRIEVELASPPSVVVLLLGRQAAVTATVFATRLPASQIHAFVRNPLDPARARTVPANVTVHVTQDVHERVAALAAVERPQLIIDASTVAKDSVSSLRHLFYFLRDGGAYLIANAPAVTPDDPEPGSRRTLAALVQRISVVTTTSESERPAGRVVDDTLAGAVSSIELGDGHVWLHKRGEHLFKLREWASDDLLTARYGDAWGRVLQQSPASSFTAKGEVRSYGDGPIASGRRTFDVPAMRLRSYHRPTVSTRQVARWGDYVLPDTWRHPHQGTLHTRRLRFNTAAFAEYLPDAVPTKHRTLAGSYYYFDTELPDHFGHITTEVLGRYWGWPLAVQHAPDVRPLLSVLPGRTGMTGFQREIFTALGVDVDRAEYIQPDEAVVVEELLAATPAFENPYYVHPATADTWRRLSENLPACDPPVVADRLFISRRRSGKRECTNTEEVEAFFADAGFTVVYPEDYPYPQQRALFAQAKQIAGFGGSGMFGMMFAPQARVIVIAGDSYRAANEELFAAANGNEIVYFWGVSEVQNPTVRFSLAAFTSNFTFDLAVHGPELSRLLRD